MVGGAYLAITPTAMMAGAALQITYNDGPLSAWLKASADAILFYKPFYLIAEAAISIGVSYRLESSTGNSGRVISEGTKVRLEMDKGSVLITSDSGKTLTILDPPRKTFSIRSRASWPVPNAPPTTKRSPTCARKRRISLISCQ